MSHFSKIQVEITDLEALRAAVARMGFEVIENAECRYYYGTQQKEIVIKLPGKYDAALEKDPEGKYMLTADFYGGHVEKYIGEKGAFLLQLYTVEKAKIEGRKRGFAVTETQGEDHILVTLRDPQGGALKVYCYPGGKTITQPDNIHGKSCMKFYDLEKALGFIEEHKLTADFWANEDPEVVQLKTAINHYLCG
jgi:hypothetical protein